MRTSVIAVAGLIACGAAAYAYVNGHLPEAVTAQIDRGIEAVTALGGGQDAAAKPSPTAARTPRPTPVEVAVAEMVRPVEEIRSIGSILADEAVDLSPEQAGRVVAIRFEEGQAVKEGDELIKLDDTLIAAELGEVEARIALAEANYQRASTLSKSGAGTQRTLDEATSERLTANAVLHLIRSRLEKTSIEAPFDGVVGLLSISVGAYVEPGDTLAHLDKIDILKVDFTVPERNLQDIKAGYPVDITVDAFPDRVFQGEIYAIDPQVDINGRALKVRARLANPDGALRPGLFARVLVRGASRGEVVLVPEGAIVPRGGESFIYRVADGRVVETKVTLGRRSDGKVEVVSGVAAADQVVVAGHARLKDGSAVEIVSPTSG